MAIILALAVALVMYGGYLNYNDSNQIANRMEERAIQLACAKVEKKFLKPMLQVETLKLYSDNMTDATALTDGRITQIFVKKNDYVQKGDIILTLVNDQLPLKVQQAESNIQRAEATYIQTLSNIQRAEAALTNAANVYDRQQRLLARNATSQEKLEAAQAEYTSAQEAVRAAKAESDSARAAIEIANAERQQYMLEVNRQNVVAPISGNVLMIYKHEGAYVQGGTPLILIGDFEKLFFSMTLEDINANYIKVGDSVTIEFNEKSLQKAYDTEYAADNRKGDELCGNGPVQRALGRRLQGRTSDNIQFQQQPLRHGRSDKRRDDGLRRSCKTRLHCTESAQRRKNKRLESACCHRRLQTQDESYKRRQSPVYFPGRNALKNR